MKWTSSDLSVAAKFETHLESGLKVPIAGLTTRSIKINAKGFRGPDLKEPKPTSLVRLAFLGASTTYCAEVSSNEMAWPHLVWKDIQSAYKGIPFDYVNGAVSGYTIAENLRNLKYRVGPLDPNVIVIYHANNDLALDTAAAAKAQGVYVQWGDQGVKNWWSKKFLAVYLVQKNIQIYLRNQAVARGENLLKLEADQLSQGFKQRLAKLVKASQEVAPVVALATFSYKIRRAQPASTQAKNAAVAIYYMPYMTSSMLLATYEAYNRVIREVAHETGAVLIEGELSIPGNDAHFTDTFHFSDQGSQKMAERVLAALKGSAKFNELLSRFSAS